MIDASTPPQHPGLGESEPRNWPAFPPKKSGEVRDMKEIAQKDPAEQFPVLSKSLSNRSLSSSASTVKVISEETKFVEGKSVECMATASDHEPNKPAGCYQNFIENSEATGLKVSIVQKALAMSHHSSNVFRLSRLGRFLRGPDYVINVTVG